MNAEEKKEPTGNPDLGAKLANFRKKLAVSIGRKKIIQPAFGEMYGGYSGRAIASYELGDSEAPASLLYEIWKQGHSIDNIFSEGPVKEEGRVIALRLYANSVTAKLKAMNTSERERVLKEVDSDKRPQSGTPEETAPKTSGKRKTGHSATRKTKKR
jgi:hypothetical protein